MVCPVCSDSFNTDDVAVIDRPGRKAMIQGKVKAVVGPEEAHFPPFSDYQTVSVYPRRGRVKYLKFATQEERDRWGFAQGGRIRCQGCLHEADGKELVFDVAEVEHL